MHDDLTPGMPPHHPAADALTRSLRAYRWTAVDKDAWTVGAAVFFGVSYDDVTPQNRARWKYITLALRHTLTTRYDELTSVREALRELPTYANKEHIADLLQAVVDRNQNDGVLTESEWTALRDFTRTLYNYAVECETVTALFKP